MKIDGKHVVADYFDCEYDFESTELISVILESIKKTNSTIVSVHEHRFQPLGRSITVILAESHFCCHTFSEVKSISLDCYTCSSDTFPMECHNYLLKIFAPKKFDLHYIKRG